MITQKDNFSIEADSMSSAKFSLKDENLAHVFNILRNNLYSDKILAVLREYSCNGFDANVENDLPNTPIQVTLPTVFEPVLKIRDLGKGLSEHDVFHIFSSYGASTKRNSNSFVGTLGMGSKSGFAYAPSFTVTSYHGGYKRVYEAFIDETEIGTIAKIIEEKSNEPTGVEITIAVKKDDVREFINTARNFYMWFNPQPQFFGYSLDKEINDLKTNLNIIYQSKHGMIFSGNDYDVTNLYVKMGNICYPVTNKTGIHADWLFNPYKLIINVEIGEVTFTTSRESLEMKELTINTINKYLDIIRVDIAKTWQADIDAKPNGWSALCHFSRMNNFQRKIIAENFNWKGKFLCQHLKLGSGEVTVYNPHKRNGQWEATYNNFMNHGESCVFILNDGGFPNSQTRARLLEAYSSLQGKGNIYFIRCSVSETHDLIRSEEFNGAKYVLLSSISAQSLKNVKKTFKDKEKVFKWNNNSYFPYSSNWTSVDSPSKMVYVKLDSFKPSGFTWEQLKSIKESLSYLGYNIEIYGVKAGAKVDDDAILLNDFLVDLAIKFAKTNEYIDTYVNSALYDKVHSGFFVRNVLMGHFSSLVDSVLCPDVKRVMSAKYSKKQSSTFNAMRNILHYAECSHRLKLEKHIQKILNKIEQETVDFKDCLNRCFKKYPLLNGLGQSYYSSISPNDAKSLVDYVNVFYRHHAEG